MKLTKKSDQVLPEQIHAVDAPSATGPTKSGDAVAGLSMDRRTFLRNSALVTGGVTLATMLVPGMMKKARAKTATVVPASG